MALTPRDELQIQRCVDGELNSQQTRDLILRLDTITDGWKTLACGLLEDRQLAVLLAAQTKDANLPTLSEAANPGTGSVGKSIQQRTGRPNRHSAFAGSGMSLLLCAAIAFVAGLWLPRESPWSGSVAGRGTSGQHSSVSDRAGVTRTTVADLAAAAQAAQADRAIRVPPSDRQEVANVQFVGGGESAPVVVPVWSGSPDHLSDFVPRDAVADFDELPPGWDPRYINRSAKLIDLTIDGNRVILVPIEEYRYAPPIP
ncbi:MAG: hypothetical protein KDA96_14060 [Planctomycetaceae bacterium]|nr:hypothetical protein [Planctomycetaceae bacterium]